MTKTIDTYKSDARFLSCSNAFIVACTTFKGKNSRLLRKNETGDWKDPHKRVVIGDALFLTLPHPEASSGYPRQLYGGVVSRIKPIKTDESEGAVRFSVNEFFLLDEMEKGRVRSFLNGKNSPTGNLIYDVWKNNSESTIYRLELVFDPYFETSSPEGKRQQVIHQKRERDPKVIKSAKNNRLLSAGKLTCDACSFNFSNIYGERGANFIEAHHKKPIHKLDGNEKTRLEDLDLVCSNCHRMLHKNPYMSIQELRLLLQESLSAPVAPHLSASTAEASA
jgi:hypothetical protein